MSPSSSPSSAERSQPGLTPTPLRARPPHRSRPTYMPQPCAGRQPSCRTLTRSSACSGGMTSRASRPTWAAMRRRVRKRWAPTDTQRALMSCSARARTCTPSLTRPRTSCSNAAASTSRAGSAKSATRTSNMRMKWRTGSCAERAPRPCSTKRRPGRRRRRRPRRYSFGFAEAHGHPQLRSLRLRCPLIRCPPIHRRSSSKWRRPPPHQEPCRPSSGRHRSRRSQHRPCLRARHCPLSEHRPLSVHHLPSEHRLLSHRRLSRHPTRGGGRFHQAMHSKAAARRSVPARRSSCQGWSTSINRRTI